MRPVYLTAAVLMLTVSAASAKTLEGPLVMMQTTDILSCTIVNLSATKTQEVTIEALSSIGTVASTSTQSIAPGAGGGITSSYPNSGQKRCRFTVDGSTKGYVAAMTLGASLFSPTVVVPIK